MLLIAHIIIALSSVVFGTYLMFRPTKRKFNVSYSLIASTLTTGTVLVIVSKSPLLQSCISGVVYVSIVTVLTVSAQRTLAHQEI